MLIVRYLDPASVTDPSLLALLQGWLDGQERARMQRFLQTKHQHAFLISHALTRAVLARAVGCHPGDIRYGKTGRDKPTLLSMTGQASHIHFNLSHTDGLAAVAVSMTPVGLDVEWLGRRNQLLDLAQRYFTATEHADILKQPENERQHRFLVYWTLKEAYLKAEAWGIVDSLDGFEFLLNEAEPREAEPREAALRQAVPRGSIAPLDIELRIRKPALSPSRPWQFWHGQPTPAHLMSLAFASDSSSDSELDSRVWLADEWLDR